MTAKRIIPCLDIKGGRVVKGVNFEDVRDVDSPVTLAKRYNEQGADELAFYDITASMEGRTLFADVLASVVAEVSIPLTVGGGIATVEDFERMLALGAAKVSLNSGAIHRPTLVAEAAKRFGGERIVLSMDVKRANGAFRVFASGGQEDTGIDAVEWAIRAEGDGAGELMINSIDTDGVKNGYDLEMLAAICGRVKIPVIASGGAGSMEHFAQVFKTIPEVGAGLAASVFHFAEIDIRVLKAFLRDQGIPVSI